MAHRVELENGVVVVRLAGEVDLQSSPEARKTLLRAVGMGERMVVSLAGVTYIDSSGVASLVEALQKARQEKVAFALAEVSEAAGRVLQLARLDTVFTIHDRLDEALGHEH